MRMMIATVVAVMLLTPGLAQAEQFVSPKALLNDIYQRYEKSDSAADGDYYSTSLQALMDANDKRVATGEDDALDFDPLSNSQDPGGLETEIAEPVISGDKATADVKLLPPFDTVLHYDFVKQANGWKIDDIHVDGADGWRLSEMLATDPLMN